MVYKHELKIQDRMSVPMTSVFWRSKGSGETTEHLPVPEGAYKKAGKGLLTRACEGL